jgi:hypothetical protein
VKSAQGRDALIGQTEMKSKSSPSLYYDIVVKRAFTVEPKSSTFNGKNYRYSPLHGISIDVTPRDFMMLKIQPEK